MHNRGVRRGFRLLDKVVKLSKADKKQIAETLPRYRAGTLSFDELVEIMRHRIGEVDEQIAAQRAVRKKLVSHVAWLEKRKREFAKRSREKKPASWPTPRKSAR